MLKDELRIWHEDTPPVDLGRRVEIDGRVLEPWEIPILVDDERDSPPAKIVLRQGENGTTPNPRRSGEVGYIGLLHEKDHIAVKGEPLAWDPASQELRHDSYANLQKEPKDVSGDPVDLTEGLVSTDS